MSTGHVCAAPTVAQFDRSVRKRRVGALGAEQPGYNLCVCREHNRSPAPETTAARDTTPEAQLENSNIWFP
jgi:hypothetical protein